MATALVKLKVGLVGIVVAALIAPAFLMFSNRPSADSKRSRTGFAGKNEKRFGGATASVQKPELSEGKKKAMALAARAFGAGHWSADKDLAIRYYNDDRGYWMYAKAYERLNDGKRLRFKPFALIWESKDGKALKTATSNVAVIDLDQPLGLTNKAKTPLKVIHARLEGDVRIGDDKGTATDQADDFVVGPMPYIEYDEATLLITSNSDVLILDRDMHITGSDLSIQLRPKTEGVPGGGGFNGAKSATLRRNVHVILSDAGPSGILPGPARSAGATGTKTPLDVRCSGPMIVELAKPQVIVPNFVGPPAPPGPTMVSFAHDVVARNCKPNQLPDQLNCDNLRLTLVPTGSVAKPSGAASPSDPKAPPDSSQGCGNAGSDLVLRRADATGNAVWIRSKADGMTARCNELIHKKLHPDESCSKTPVP